jgi:GntR family transcriptional regulator, transcriptional repressor for pyruvate dehydrogenase complex
MSKPKTVGMPSSLNRVRVADQILRELKDQITSGELPKGSKLPAERQLAEHYNVSSPTVREAIRGLTALGLVDVRHGSGASVTINSESLIAESLGTVIRLEGLGAAEVLGVLGVLNEHAAGLASKAATKEDHQRLRAALEQLDSAQTPEAAVTAVRAFHHAIALAARNPLLTAICGFLVNLQTKLGTELAGNSIAVWSKMFKKLRPTRTRLLNAIIAGDQKNAVKLAREFHQKAFQLITSLPKAKEVRLTDPTLSSLVHVMTNRIREN